MNSKEAHEKWVHQYKNNCDKVAKYMGIKLQVIVDCAGCGLVKAIKKWVAKVTKIRATKEEKHVYIDTTGPYL